MNRRGPATAICRRAVLQRLGAYGIVTAQILLLGGCGGGSGEAPSGGTPSPTPTPTPAPTPTPSALYTRTTISQLQAAQTSVPAFQDQVPVFVSVAEASPKSGTSKQYRAPGVVRGKTLVHAFAEARFNRDVDGDEISVAWRTLSNHGDAVSAETILVEDIGPWADGVRRRNTNHTPCPVYDPTEGHLHLLFGHRRGDVDELTATLPSVNADTADVGRAIVSPDGDGAQWFDRVGGARLDLPVDYSRAAEINGRHGDWRLFFPGPGHGICMPDGTLLAPAWTASTNGTLRTAVLRYDRGTRTWSLSGVLPIESNEASLTWSDTGKLIVNARRPSGGGRVVAISSDHGATWDSAVLDASLPDPVCFGSVLRFGRTGGPGMILFTNPANSTERRDLTVRLSLSDHARFEVSRQLYPDYTETVTTSWEGKAIRPTVLNHFTAYSDLVELDDGMFGFLLEQTIASNFSFAYTGGVISLVRANLSWLLANS